MGVIRERWRWHPELGCLVQVPIDSEQPRPQGPAVWDDLPDYESPVTGQIVSGRRQRREDLKSSGCRPYEGRDQEAQQAAKVQAENDRRTDQIAERLAHEAWRDAPEHVRRVFRGR
jgi:hypothetical protein